MAFSPIAFIAPYYRKFNGHWFKAYEPGTTAPKPVAVDASGSGQAAKLQINEDGFLLSSGGAIVTPFIDGAYDAYLFPTESEADNNDTINAERVADNLEGVDNSSKLSIADIGDYASYEFDTVANAKLGVVISGEAVTLKENDVIRIKERGSALFDVVSGASGVNGFDIIAHSVLDLSFSLRVEGVINVVEFGAKGDGLTDDVSTLNFCLEQTGAVYLPKGTYLVSDTLILRNDTILYGDGAGAYFAGGGFDRISVIKVSAAFAGTEVIRADPSDTGVGGVYRFGIGVRDLCIDFDDRPASAITAMQLRSVSNCETFSNLRVINNDNGRAIDIGISSNASALLSDGLEFRNIITLPKNQGAVTNQPVVYIEATNEVAFYSSKFQGSDATSSGTSSVQVVAGGGNTVNAATFFDCSFTGAENGITVQSFAAAGQGARWIRALNCTFEGVKFGVTLLGDATRPTQFCSFTGNRHQATQPGGSLYNLQAYASNNYIEFDDYLPSGSTKSVVLTANANGNVVKGPVNNTSNSGANNVTVGRSGDTQTVYNESANAMSSVESGGGFSAQQKVITDTAEWTNLGFGSSSPNSGMLRLTKDGNAAVQYDDNSAVNQTRFWVYDVNTGQLQRVSVGANDSGGAGFKVLRIPN